VDYFFGTRMSYSNTKKTVTNYKYGGSSYYAKNQESSSKKNRKNKNKNKPREVTSWDDIDENGNQTQQPQKQEKRQKFIPPKYTQEEIKKMKWADIDEISDEDFYGYFVDLDD
jgi:hypothetical protein